MPWDVVVGRGVNDNGVYDNASLPNMFFRI